MSEIYNWEDEEDWIMAPVLEKLTLGQVQEMRRILDMIHNFQGEEIILELDDDGL